jgi:hypothetical protein
MKISLSTFRNKASLLLAKEQSKNFEAKVKQQYEDIKTGIEADGYRGYWMAIILFIGSDSEKAMQANGYYNKSWISSQRFKLNALLRTMRYNQVLVSALEDQGMLATDSALYRYGQKEIDKALGRKHEDWNVAAAVQYIKELSGTAAQALTDALKRREKAVAEMDSMPVLQGLSNEGLHEAFHLNLFGLGDKVTEDQISSLDDYKDEGYESLNKSLRTEAKSKAGPLTYPQQRMMEDIDKALTHFVSKKELKVQRGMKFENPGEFKAFAKAMAGLKPGTIIEDRGFVSTTMHSDTAHEFASGSKIHTSIKMDIEVPKGSKAMPIGAFLHSRGARANIDVECEILLPRKSRFEIMEYVKDKTTDKPEIVYLRLRLVTSETVNKTQAYFAHTGMEKNMSKPPINKPITPAPKKGTPSKNKPNMDKFVYTAEQAMTLKVVKPGNKSR